MTSKEKAADNRLRQHYHITLEEYKCVLKYQKGLCAICRINTSFDKRGGRLAVDHDHGVAKAPRKLDGLLRGLLCFKCNKLLGVFEGFWRGNPEVLERMAEYLRNPPMTICLGERLTAPGRVGTKKRAKVLKSMKGRNE